LEGCSLDPCVIPGTAVVASLNNPQCSVATHGRSPRFPFDTLVTVTDHVVFHPNGVGFTWMIRTRVRLRLQRVLTALSRRVLTVSHLASSHLIFGVIIARQVDMSECLSAPLKEVGKTDVNPSPICRAIKSLRLVQWCSVLRQPPPVSWYVAVPRDSSHAGHHPCETIELLCCFDNPPS
jgi:hypothetical protein